MGKYNRKPKLRSVTRTRARKSVRRPELSARSVGAEDTMPINEKKSRKGVLLAAVLLLLLIFFGLSFALVAKDAEPQDIKEDSAEPVVELSAEEALHPPGI